MSEEKIKITQLTPQGSDFGNPNECIIPIVNTKLMQTRKLSLESLLAYLEYFYRDPLTNGSFTLNCEGGLEFRDGGSYSTSKIINLGSTITLTDIDTKTLATSAMDMANNVTETARQARATSNVAFYTANNAHNKANSAYDYAELAYNLAEGANTIAKTANTRANDTYTINGTKTNFVKKFEPDTLSYQLTISESSSSVTDKGLKLGTQGYLVCRDVGLEVPSKTNTCVQILSDYGIGFGTSWNGSSVGFANNTMWINTRLGNIDILGNLTIGATKHIYRGDSLTKYLYDGISGATFTGYTDVQHFRCTGAFSYTTDEPTITFKSNLFTEYTYNIRFDSAGQFVINYNDPDIHPAFGLYKSTNIGRLFGNVICAPAISPIFSTANYVVGYNGSTYSLYDYARTSDERIKKIHGPITNATEKLLNLRTVYGEYTKKELKENNRDNGKRIFLIAQDVEKEFPGIVYDSEEKIENGESLKVMYYERLIPALVASIKELKQEIEELKEKINV